MKNLKNAIRKYISYYYISDMKNILQDLGITNSPDEKDNSLLNIFKKPDKTPNKELPHVKVPEKGMTYQADLLMLPNDHDYRYLLVVIDNNNNACDFQELKVKTATACLDAIKEIFKRKYLNKPHFMLEVDNGGEFKGVFKSFFENCKVKKDRIYVKQNYAGRHKSQSIVENLNKLLGRIIMMVQTQEEIDTHETVRDWVHLLPKLRVSINKHLRRNKSKVIEDQTLLKCEGELIPIGANVRVQLDNPRSVSGEKLIGNFRAGDPRWSIKIHKVEEYILRINQPPMYAISDISHCVYTKQQLQVVSENESRPKQTKFIISKLVRRFKEKGKVFFEVKWQNERKTTIEPRTSLIHDVPDMILEFEKKND